MPAMRDALSPRPRVIVYVFASPLLGEQEDLALVAQVEQICVQEDVACVATVVDRGPPKQRCDEYPVLARMRGGDVDALLVVRSPLYTPGVIADRLEAACPPGPFAWLSQDELHAAGLLPPAAKVSSRPRRRPKPVQRARALRAQGLGLRQIGHTLTAEGYPPPAGAAWTAAGVATLLGLVVLDGGADGEAADAAAPR